MHLVIRIGLVIAAFSGLGFPSDAGAQTYSSRLKRHYADFALMPGSSIVAAANAEGNRVDLYRVDFADYMGAPEDRPPLTPISSEITGEFPCALLYKELIDPKHGKAIALVVGSNKSDRLHLTYPVSQDFRIAAKGLVRLASSADPADPLVYYTIGGDVSNSVGAFDVVALRDLGILRKECLGFDVSRDGKIGYFRHKDSTEVVSITRTATGEPTFEAKSRRPQAPQGEYASDVLGKFVWSANTLFSPDLGEVKATLEIAPFCSVRAKPFLIGLRQVDQNSPTVDTRPLATLEAISTNTFQRGGAPVALLEKDVRSKNYDGSEIAPHPTEAPELTGTPLRGIGPNWKRVRVFEDEKSKQIVYCETNRIHLIPLTKFELPEEFRLAAKVEGAREMLIGKENRLEVALPESNAQVEFERLPFGMKQDGNALLWKPTEEQLGKETIKYKVKVGGETRDESFEVDVLRPNIRLPFEPCDFAIDAASQYAVIWGDPPVPGASTAEVKKSTKIAVIDLKTAKVTAERTVDIDVRDASIGSGFVGVSGRAAGEGDNCLVLALSDLKTRRSLRSMAGRHSKQVYLGDGRLFFHKSETELEVYDFPTLSKPQLLPRLSTLTEQFSPFTPEGCYYHGVLYGDDAKPKLFANSFGGIYTRFGGIHTIGNMVDAGSHPEFINSAWGEVDLQEHVLEGLQLGNLARETKIANVKVPGIGLRATLTITPRPKVSVRLAFVGTEEKRIVIAHDPQFASSPPNEVLPVSRLKVNRQHAFVVHGDRLYRASVPSLENPEERGLIALSIAPEQSQLTLSKGVTTKLKHRVTGGKAPITFSLSSEYEALKIDSHTGIVTVDNKAAIAKVKEQLIENQKNWDRELTTRRQNLPFDKHIEGYQKALLAPLNEFFDKKFTEYPCAIAISVVATDDALRLVRLDYKVIFEGDVKFSAGK